VLILEVYKLKGFYLDNRYIERKEYDLVRGDVLLIIAIIDKHLKAVTLAAKYSPYLLVLLRLNALV